MRTEKLVVVDAVSGFTERESHSKAILNTDVDSLLSYKIRKRKFSEMRRTTDDMTNVKNEVEQIKSDLSEIKQLLLQITQK